jgi:hypothetical protein
MTLFAYPKNFLTVETVPQPTWQDFAGAAWRGNLGKLVGQAMGSVQEIITI